MANVLMGVTGSVAAIKTPDLYRLLAAEGWSIRIVSTSAGLYFFDPGDLPGGVLVVDADEWPRAAVGERYQRDDLVLHIELRRWADLLLAAPLDANTLAKFALGLCDNCLCCIWRAWDQDKPMVLAPAMNTLMWEHPATKRHFRQIIEDVCGKAPPQGLELDELLAWLNRLSPRCQVIGPTSKRLACGDVGLGGMAEIDEIAAAVRRALAATP